MILKIYSLVIEIENLSSHSLCIYFFKFLKKLLILYLEFLRKCLRKIFDVWEENILNFFITYCHYKLFLLFQRYKTIVSYDFF